MAVADDADLDQPHRSRRHSRAGPAGAIGPGRVERVAQRARHSSRREQCVEQQRTVATRFLHIGGKPLVDEVAERLQPARRQRQSGRHRMPAARDQQSAVLRGEHGSAQVHAGDRAPRPLPVPSSVSAITIAGRPKRSFIRPATMPITPWCQPPLITMMTGASVCSRRPVLPPAHTPASRSRGAPRSAGRVPRRSPALPLDPSRSAAGRRGRTCRRGRRR